MFYLLIWGIVQKFRGVTVPGWSSLIVSIWALGGLILLSIGVIGEYIGKIYMETKGRPRFLIDEKLNKADRKEEDPMTVDELLAEIQQNANRDA